jgi:hypothetical protein
MLVLFISMLALSPFIILNTSLPDEAWLISAAREMSQSFSMVPRLDGFTLGNQNPLVVMLYSLTGGDLYISRLATVSLGLVMVISVMMFAGYMWDLKSGILSAVLTATSLGAISIFGRTDPSALPVMMSASAFMIFSAAYMKNLSRMIYVPAYILAVVSVVTGGPVYLFFFLLSGILLILLDLSPSELLRVKPMAAVILLAGGSILVYAVLWITGGRVYMKGAISQGKDMGFFYSLWLIFKNGLPWIPLLIPAWIYSARPTEFTAWRELLPAKIALISCLAILWLSGKCPETFSVLAVPYSAVLIAGWVSGGSMAFVKSGRTGFAASIAAVVSVFLIPVFYIVKFPFKSLHPGIFDAVVISCLVVCCSAAFIAVQKKKAVVTIIFIILALLGMSWLRPFYEMRLNNPAGILSYYSNHKPLIVFDDDLVMRGKLASARPDVVGKCFVPVGGEAYIAAATENTEKLMKDIRKNMSAELKIRQILDRDYLLIKVWPKGFISN